MSSLSLARLLGTWGVANLLPYLILYLGTGQTYAQLPAQAAWLGEAILLGLNLLLPFWALRRVGMPLRRGWLWMGWTRPGWKGALWGLAGLAAAAAVALAVQVWVAEPVTTPGFRVQSAGEMALALVLLLVLTALAEETMFRGFLQTGLSEKFGAPVGMWGSALLFGLRYLPGDLYGATLMAAGPANWAARGLQLGALALILGWIRHKTGSTWVSWLAREGMLVLIVLASALTAL